MDTYIYKGPVKEFGKIINNNWEAVTMAPNERKARANLIFRYKQRIGKIAAARIELPGELKKWTAKI